MTRATTLKKHWIRWKFAIFSLVIKMDDYKIRLDNAKKDIATLEGSEWEIATLLWQKGYSLRIIEEVLGITRSKLQRYFSENKIEKVDDIRTQNKNERVGYAIKLNKMGFSKQEIANELDLNVRTVELYLKQGKILEATKFGRNE